MRLDVKSLTRSCLMVAVVGTALVGTVARADDDDEGHHHWRHHHGYYVVPPGHVYYVPAPPPVVYYPAPVYVPAYPAYIDPGPPGINLNFNVPLR